MSSWNMALRSLRRRRTRTAFTVSGIVVGVGMILVLLSLAAGTSTTANQFIRALGVSEGLERNKRFWKKTCRP